MAIDYYVGGSALTDFKDDDKSSSAGAENFKERILRELEEANRKRQLQEEEQKRAEEARQAEQARRQEEQEAITNQETVSDENTDISFESENPVELSSESQDDVQDESLTDTETRAELAEAISRQKPIDAIEAYTQTQDSQNETLSTSELIPEESTSESLAEQYQTESEPIETHESNTESLGSPVVAPVVAATDGNDEAMSSEGVTENSSVSESIEAQNEAVVAEVEAKESITEDKQPSMNRKKKNRKIAAKIAGILVTVILIVGLLTAFLGYRYVSSSLGAVDSDSKKFVTVQIPEGSGNKLIGQILEENGLVKNASIFNYYTRFKNVSDLQSGYYNLQKSMTVEEIIDTLKQGGTTEPQEPVSGKILVTEGYTIDQIAKAVTTNVNTKKASKTPYSEKDFLDLMKNKDFINKMVKKYPELLKDIPSADKSRYQLEGYLFPATYDYYEESTLEDLVDQMLATMNTNLGPYYDQIAIKGHTVNEILTLASLVEKEGSTDEDRRNIASVFYNRLNIQMPLQSNIAILYAMGKLGQETTLREDAAIDTKINSPYNIYENPGLMPGPVDSPGLSAIEATVNPADTDNLYFVADVTTGDVYYAEDYATHETNVSKYVNAHLDK